LFPGGDVNSPAAEAALRGRLDMSGHQLKGKWREVRGHIREYWGRLTRDDQRVLAGQRDQLIGKVQQRYGTAADQAERRVAALEARASRLTGGR
jgi:uncharacterized protein YjbJ (UPF0337 family)